MNLYARIGPLARPFARTAHSFALAALPISIHHFLAPSLHPQPNQRVACTLVENRKNKYRGGTSDATTSSSLIVSLIVMSFDDFLPSKTALFAVGK